jgi:hypothetical protein
MEQAKTLTLRQYLKQIQTPIAAEPKIHLQTQRLIGTPVINQAQIQEREVVLALN